MVRAASRGNPNTDVDAASASMHLLASTVALWNGVSRGAAVVGSIRWWKRIPRQRKKRS